MNFVLRSLSCDLTVVFSWRSTRQVDTNEVLLWFFCSLLKSNGSLLAFAGSSDKEARVTAAIASSIWSAYHSNIKQSFHTESLNFVLMDCDVCCYVYLYLFCANIFFLSTHM